MGRLRGRIKKVLDAAADEKSTLVCPECGGQFVVYGDASLQYLAWNWEQASGAEVYQKTPEDVLRLTEHEHDASFFVNEDGDPWLGEFFRDMGPTMRELPENVPDFSEGG
jgi:Ribonuclease G/E